MKVTYQTCSGVDVHKSFLVATIVKTTGGIEPSYQKKRFSTFNNSILEFKLYYMIYYRELRTLAHRTFVQTFRIKAKKVLPEAAPFA